MGILTFLGLAKKETKKEQKITENSVRIRIHRPRNNTPVEIGVFIAEMSKDSSQNVILINDSNKFKEDLSVLTDSCISDIKYKLKTRSDTREKQISELCNAIKEQEDKIKDVKDGKILTKTIIATEKDEKGKEKEVQKEVKVNIVTEENKLRLLKVTKYAIETSGDGSFEIIEQDGMPCMSYLVQDGELIPEFYRMPKEKGEILTIRPEASANKKHYKETQDIIDRDYLDSTKDPFSGLFGLIFKILLVVIFIVGIFWNVQLSKREADISQREKESASGICLRTQAECTRLLGFQIETNQNYIDIGKAEVKRINASREEGLENPKKI